MERWIWFLGMAVFYGVLFLWFLNQVKKPDYKKNYVLVKTLQSAAFVSVFLAAAVVSQDILDFWLMLPAFVCCFAGDVMLAFYNKIKKKRLFLLGLVTFLMGHLFFIRWLDRMQPLAVTDSRDRSFCCDRNGQLSYWKTPAMHFGLHFFYCISVCKKHAYCSEYPWHAAYRLCGGKFSVYDLRYFYSVSLFL